MKFVTYAKTSLIVILRVLMNKTITMRIKPSNYSLLFNCRRESCDGCVFGWHCLTDTVYIERFNLNHGTGFAGFDNDTHFSICGVLYEWQPQVNLDAIIESKFNWLSWQGGSLLWELK
jgi:hypothetical protein